MMATSKMKGATSPLKPAVVFLFTLLVSIDSNNQSLTTSPNNKSTEWILEKCLTSTKDEESSVVCYTPSASLISCEGIRNADKCSKAIAKYANCSSATLSRLTKDSFVFDVQNHRLCFKPQINSSGSVHTFFGYDLWVEFFDSANPGAKTLVRLGAIFRSGVPNRTTLQSTFGCVKTPAHIPYRNTSFFITTGNTLPIQAYRNRTRQEKGYSLGSLRKVSFTDGAHLKDYVNSSTPLFQFKCSSNYPLSPTNNTKTYSNGTRQEKEDSLSSLRKVSSTDGAYLKDYVSTSTPLFEFKTSSNYPPTPKHGKGNEWGWILLVIGPVALIVVLIGSLVYIFRWLGRSSNKDTVPGPPQNGQNPPQNESTL